jgi:hypothetical protein
MSYRAHLRLYRQFSEPVDRFQAVARLTHHLQVLLLFQQLAEALPEYRVIVN